MEEISWGNLLVTLLLPLLAVIWMRFVLRRKALHSPVEEPYSTFARVAVWVAGFVITWAFSTFLGFYLLAQISTGGAAQANTGLTILTGFATPYISGLWGALVPYHMLAREGKESLITWLGAALAYAVVFYLSTLFF